MPGRLLTFLVLVSLCLPTGPVRAQNLFDLRNRAATSGYATLDHHAPAEATPTSPMLDRLDGVPGRLTPADLKLLRACIAGPSGKIEGVDEALLMYVLTLRAGSESLTVEIRRTADGTLVARRGSMPGDPPGQPGRVERLDDDRFFQITRRWPAYRGGFAAGPEDPKPGALVQLTQPAHGWVTFNKETLGERLLRGRKTRVEGITRKIEEDEIWARVPKAYDPRSPAGLLVWVGASPIGRPPETIFSAADELGLVCVSQAEAGNDCPIADRYQRVFDAIATASARFHIDPRQVYVSGISGGGKVSSVLWACFPDLFSGSVPIVGLACYENVPIGNGQIWPGLYDKPKPPMFSLLKQQRCGAITGPKDFNYDSIVAAQKVLARDGLNARVFEHAELAHTMPTPGQFAEALKWVDEPYRELRAAEVAEAARLLAEFNARARKEPALAAADRRRLLVAITAAGPWTPAAWEAVSLLERP